jgi:hypothetical protein
MPSSKVDPETLASSHERLIVGSLREAFASFTIPSNASLQDIQGLIYRNLPRFIAQVSGKLIDLRVKSAILTANDGIKIPENKIKKLLFSVDFNRVDDKSVRRAKDFQNRFIVEITQQAAQVVQLAISNGIKNGYGPDKIATGIRELLPLTTRQAQAVMNYRTALETANPKAIGWTIGSLTTERKLRDRRFDAKVKDSVQTGIPLSQETIDKLVGQYSTRMANHRALTVARTETLRAVNAGQNEAYEQMDEKLREQGLQLKRFWVHAKDARVRDEHRMIPKLNEEGVAIGEAFRYPDGRSIMLPGDPNAEASMTINCRCTIAARVV